MVDTFAGPDISADAYLSVKAGVSSDLGSAETLWGKLNGGIEGSVGGKVQFLSWNLGSFDMDLFDREWEIYSWTSPNFLAGTPDTPSGLTADALTSSRVELNWTDLPTDEAVSGYKIFRDGVFLSSAVNASFADTAVSPETSYCYSVSAYSDSQHESAQSPQVCVTTPVLMDTTAPAVPTGLTATASSAGQVDLSWDSLGSPVVGYKLYRNGIPIASETTNLFSDTGLAGGTPYCYTVSSFDDRGNVSTQSSQACATTPSGGGGVTAAHPLNDTGIDWFADATTNFLTSEPVDFPGQDASYGRDAKAAAGTLVKVGGGAAGFDFTKIGADGSALSADAASWSCVHDNVTGLMWEVKTTDGGLRDRNNTYSWYNPDPSTNGGSAGTQNGGSCTGGIACDTASYVAAVNAAGLCGYSDWRLPAVEELRSIVDYGIAPPGLTIDAYYFPNTLPLGFWSESPYAGNSDLAWYVNFGYGYDYRDDKGNYQRRSVGARRTVN